MSDFAPILHMKFLKLKTKNFQDQSVHIRGLRAVIFIVIEPQSDKFKHNREKRHYNTIHAGIEESGSPKR